MDPKLKHFLVNCSEISSRTSGSLASNITLRDRQVAAIRKHFIDGSFIDGKI